MANLATLVTFNGTNGSTPGAGLIIDANGYLFGTTQAGGDSGDGTVFEIADTAGSYASRVLVSFNGTDGSFPDSALIADAHGDLFGTTVVGGTSGTGNGTVFEIAKTAAYASTPITLVSFNGANGANPLGLIADANGDLFGAAVGGGANGDGTVSRSLTRRAPTARP